MQPAKKKTAPCNKHLLAVVREEKKTAMQPVKKKTAMQPAKKKTAPCDKHSLAVVREGKKTAMQPVKKKTAMQPAKKKTAMKPAKKKTASCNKHLLAVEKRESVGSNSRPACSIRVKPTSRTLKLSVFNSPHSLFNKDKWGKLPSN
jgi:hypothetical protein